MRGLSGGRAGGICRATGPGEILAGDYRKPTSSILKCFGLLYNLHPILTARNNPPPHSHGVFGIQTPEVNLIMGDYYLDGPVFLKSGIHLNGIWSEDDSPYETQFSMHGSGTGADGVINADGVSGAMVSFRTHPC